MECRTTSCSGQRTADGGRRNTVAPAASSPASPPSAGNRPPSAGRRSTVGGRRENAGTPLPSPPPTAYRLPATAQEGFTLAGLLVILTIISVVIAMTVPEQWSMVMHRERDKQTLFMMKQAARAIRTWQRKHSALPTSLDQLKEAKQPRVLRFAGEEFPMPLTGKEDDWILVPLGAIEAQPTVPGGAANQPGVGPNPNPGTPGQPPVTGPSKLRKEASPKDYVGPFVGIRPNMSGKSFLAPNGAEDYSEWVYTTQDLENEIQMRIAAINVK